jgi:hypothetical protein
MEKCKNNGFIKAVYFIDVSDIKEITPEDGIVMKRKYGKFDRKIRRVDY